MIPRQHGLAWAPALLVGLAAAIAAEVAVGMLLYAGPGLARSLTAVLAVEGVALSVGLWTAPEPGPAVVEHLRQRWLLCLGAFLVAALFGIAWSLVEEVGSGRLGQGLGLGVLAGLPLYAAGGVLGGMAAAAVSDPHGPLRGPGAPASLGAGVGFVFTGLLLPRAPLPASLLIAALVVLSSAGMLYGSVLASRLQVRTLASVRSHDTEISVEERSLPASGYHDRVILEGGYERGSSGLGNDGEPEWAVAVATALMPSPEIAWRLLLVGGGASAVARTMRAHHPLAIVDVVEPSPEVVDLARTYLGTELHVGPGPRGEVRVGNLEDSIALARGPYDLVIVDQRVFGPMSGAGGLSRAARRCLAEAAGQDGVIARGPDASGKEVEPAPGRTVRAFVRMTTRGEEGVSLDGPSAEPAWATGPRGFQAVQLAGTDDP